MHDCYANKLEVTNQHCPFSHNLAASIMAKVSWKIIAYSTYKKILLQVCKVG